MSTVAATLRAFLLPHAAYFRAKGWRVDGLARGARDCAECREHFDHLWDAEWVRRSLNPLAAVKAAVATRRLVTEQGYDLVHVHTPVASFLTRTALVRRPSTAKVIYTAHGFHFHPLGSRLMNAAFLSAEKLAGGWTDELITINRVDDEAAKAHRLVAPGHVHLIPGVGIDLDAYRRERVEREQVARLREELALPEEAALLSMVAEFNTGKRHEDAIVGLSLARVRHVHLAFAGVGPRLEAMKRLARDRGVARRVHFLGFRTDVPTLLVASEASLLTSLREGLPRAVLESIALGTPVIGTRVRGIDELLERGAGLLVPPRDPRAVANAIDLLFTDAGLRERLRAACGMAIAPYALDHVLSMNERVYRACLGEPAPKHE